MPKKRVFFLNWAGHDLRPAKKFSDEIIMITKGDQDLFELDRLRYRIRESLTRHNFNTDTDYLVLSGSSIMTYIVGTIMGEQFQHVTVLLWDAKKQTYKVQDHSPKTNKI